MLKTSIIALSIFCLVLLLFTNCNKTESNECGCDSEILYEIPDSSALQGEIAFKIQLDSLDDYYNNKYWVGYTEQNCSNCIHHFIVCNEEFINPELKSELLAGKQITVNFSGIVKETCEKTFAHGDYTFNRIILTKIEKQKKNKSRELF